MKDKTIVVCSDHAGYPLKEYLKNRLILEGFNVKDMGVYNSESVDYPDIIKKGAKAISEGKYDKGLFICGSGEGTTMAANRFKKVRAALVWNKATAKLSREHNNSNVIVFGARVISAKKAYKLFKLWWSTSFTNDDRHIRRIKKLDKLGN